MHTKYNNPHLYQSLRAEQLRSISYTVACADLSTIMQKVCQDHVSVMITRPKAEPVVMIALSDFEDMQETNYTPPP